jgi:hypothetical protein
MIEKFCVALRLDARDSKYFTNLVHFNQAKTAREKQDYYAVLRSLGDPVREEVIRGANSIISIDGRRRSSGRSSASGISGMIRTRWARPCILRFPPWTPRRPWRCCWSWAS